MSEFLAKNKADELDYIKITNTKTGEEITLQFSRASALFAQSKGFSVGNIDVQPGLVVPDLFFYAMRKNHGNMARANVDRLRESLFPNGLPMKVIQRLAELYDEACLVQVVDTNEDEGKNALVEIEM